MFGTLGPAIPTKDKPKEVKQVTITNDLSCVVNLAKSMLRDMDKGQENYTCLRSTAELMLSTLIALSEGRDMSNKPWINQHVAAIGQYVGKK